MVLDAVHLYLNDERNWDALVGKLITEPKRLADVVRLEDQDYEYLDKWGSEPQSILTQIQQSDNQSFLQRTPGVSYATSRISGDNGGDNNFDGDSNSFVDRLYAGGVMFEVHNDQLCSKAFHCIERGLPLTHNLLVPHMTNELQSVLVRLIEEGYLVARD